MAFTRSIGIIALLATGVGLAATFFPIPVLEVAQAQTQPGQAPSVRPPAQTQPGQAPAPVRPPASRFDQAGRATRTVWHEGETLRQEDDWVESTFSANDKEGKRLILAVQGSVEVQSIQVQLADGQVQPVQVRTQPYESGEYLLLNFDSSQQIESVNVVGRTDRSKSAYSVQLRK